MTDNHLLPIPADVWAKAAAHAETIGENLPREVGKFLRAYPKRKPRGKVKRRAPGEGSFFQRSNGLWVGRVELEPTPDGKRDYVEVTSVDKAKAIDKFETLKRDIADHIECLKTGMTVERWMLQWAEQEIKPNKTPKYYANIVSTISQQIVPAIGAVKMDKLAPSHVRHMVGFVRDATDAVMVDGELVEKPRWSSRTVQLAFDILGRGVEAARRERPPLVRENVVKLVARPAAKSAETPHHTTEQAEQVLAAALAAHDPYVTLYAARYLTTMRQGELLGLEESRLDFDNLTIDKSWQLQWLKLKENADPDDPDRFDAPDYLQVRPLYRSAALVRPKTGKSYLLPMPPQLAVMLRIYLENRAPNPYGLLWVSPVRGTPINKTDDNARWREAQERAGVPVIPGHGTRHTGNTALGDLGVPEEVRMKILGQSTAAANRIYLHTNLDHLREAMGALAGMLLPENIVPDEQRLT